ncbi:MAG: hypothetical protein R3C11_14965 [Planctomycetaceae bacterium]
MRLKSEAKVIPTHSLSGSGLYYDTAYVKIHTVYENRTTRGVVESGTMHLDCQGTGD